MTSLGEAPPIDQKSFVIDPDAGAGQLWHVVNAAIDDEQTTVIYEEPDHNPVAVVMPYREYMDLMSVRWSSLRPLVERVEELETKVRRMYDAGVIMPQKPAEGHTRPIERLVATTDKDHAWEDRHGYEWGWIKWADQTHDWGRRSSESVPYERLFGTIHWPGFAPFTRVDA